MSTIIIIITFGLIPSFIWLLWFLRKDSHPESNKMILKIFTYGMLITIIAALIELGFFKAISIFKFSSLTFLILYYFIGIALVEEGLKYLVVREKVLSNPEFDEPVDAMLYMIIAALGFAALENMLVLFPGDQIIQISALRFAGATFLHALCSATVGYFLALSLFETKKRPAFIIIGLAAATFLHGIYNFSIIKTEDNPYFILIPIILLISLAFFVSFGFRKLKKMASVCKTT